MGTNKQKRRRAKIEYPLDVSDEYILLMMALHEHKNVSKAIAQCTAEEIFDIAELVSDKRVSKYYGFDQQDVIAALQTYLNKLKGEQK